MNALVVEQPGLLSTIQDGGRYGYQDQGISPSGAMDTLAMTHANLLVDNPPGLAVLEMTLLAGTYVFGGDALVALTGADMDFRVNGCSVPRYQTLVINAGDRLEGGYARVGARAYLALRGGFSVPPVLKSRSTFLRAKIGGHKGRKLQRGDAVPFQPLAEWLPRRTLPAGLWEPLYGGKTIRFIWGDETEAFTPKGIETFTSSTYTVEHDSDRMGYRLKGEPIELAGGGDILSGPIQFGSIQVPGSGQPIVMMADRQTTGGYTMIGQVIQMDLPLLAQKKPGEAVAFAPISIEQAVALWRAHHRERDAFFSQLPQAEPQREKPRRLAIGLGQSTYTVTIRERSHESIHHASKRRAQIDSRGSL